MIGCVPTPIRLIGRADVERLLEPAALIDALVPAFEALSAGRASVPPRTAARTGAGLLGVMPGYLPGPGLGVKLVSVFAGNHERGLPSHQAVIALFDEADGRPLALIDGTAITALRTGAAAALATRVLARPDARVLAVLGAGVQGRAHLQTVPLVRDFAEIRVASRNPEHARGLAAGFSHVRAVDSFQAAVRGADVVCCCTDAPDPILDAAWLAPGAHVTSVGANPNGRGELPREVVKGGLLCVESKAAFLPPPAGAAELQGLDPEPAVELGELLAGTRPGRAGAGGLTVYKSMGHAVEDLVAARLVFERAAAEGAGTLVEL